MCKLLEVSRSGFYAWVGREESGRSRADRELLEKIREIHQESRRIYGAPRIHRELRAQGIRCGQKRVARLMREAGIRGKVRRKFRTTTDSNHSQPVAPNLLAELGEVDRPNQVWVADITYIPTQEGWLYLASIMDLFSRKIVGWSLQANMRTGLVLCALEMALKRRQPPAGLIHHSDRGSQYASEEYQEILKEHGLIASMSGKGNCYDNAAKESFFHSLKTELVHDANYHTRDEGRLSIFEYIECFYNRKRRHSSLDYESPADFEASIEGEFVAA